MWAELASIGVMGSVLLGVTLGMRNKGLHRWLPTYVRTRHRRQSTIEAGGPVHVLLCVCDHFEPKLGGASMIRARERVNRWRSEYPRAVERFHDVDGRSPRHTFFYPVEEYEPEFLDTLAELSQCGLGEVEVHLHHENDDADNLRRTLMDFKHLLRTRHGLLGRERSTGEIAYGFIHGNWALDNARCDGRWCGVNNELDVLRESGCYADFTLPSAPSETQTRKINSVYWARGVPAQRKSHDWGTDLGRGPRPDRSLLMIQGPLVLDWNRRKFGLFPGIENACLQGTQPPTMNRLGNWLRACVQVRTRPDWYFVKLHTHGANERNMPVLLGEEMARFHEGLAALRRKNSAFHYHYVSAREMANLALAAHAGWTGTVSEARDYAIVRD